MATASSPVARMNSSSEMKDRILKHMNKDHRLSLFDYLEYYGRVPLDGLDPKNRVEMVDIELDHLTLQYSSHFEQRVSRRIDLQPPLKSLAGAREKLVEMAHTAATALGVSPTQVKHYKWPQTPGAWLSSSTGLILVLGGLTHEFGLAKRFYPTYDQSLQRFRLFLVLFLILIHIGECILIMRPLMKKYRVPYDVRPQWYLSCVLEGFFSWVRFKSLVKKH